LQVEVTILLGKFATMMDNAAAFIGGRLSIDSDDGIDDIAKHPISCLWKAWKGSNKKERKSFDFQPFRESFQTYLAEVRGEEFCYDVFHRKQQLMCTCMSTMPLEGDELEKVLLALIIFSTKTKLERNYVLAEWIWYARCLQDLGKGPRAYLLPGGNHFVCQHALSRVSGIQKYHVFTVNKVNSDRLICQEADGYPLCFDDNVIKKQYRGKEWAQALVWELQPLKKTGMKDIKWITLYNEWRPLILLDFQQKYQYFHEDPGTKRREKTRINRGKKQHRRDWIEMSPSWRQRKSQRHHWLNQMHHQKQSNNPQIQTMIIRKRRPSLSKRGSNCLHSNKAYKEQKASKGPFVLWLHVIVCWY
jgi:hypothetical protein